MERTETLSAFQKRLFSSFKDGRSFDIGLVYNLSEIFSTLFVEDDGAADFVGEDDGLCGILRQLLLIGTLLDVDVGIAVRRKYRHRCPRCRVKTCICWNWEEKPPYRHYPGSLPAERTLWKTQQMLNKVFPKRQSLAEEVQHVRKEIVELIDAIGYESGYQSQTGIEEEIADVFARLARVANTLRISLDQQRPFAR